MAIDNLVNKLSEQLSQILPPGVKTLREDFEENVKSVLREAFTRMDLVTREEFEVQAALLSKTRIKLEAMEAKLKGMESLLTDLEKSGNQPS